MTKTEIEEYLLNCEHQLLIKSQVHKFEMTRSWSNKFESSAGVYAIKEEGEICYVGETGKLKGRIGDLLNTKNHSIRIKIGEEHFSQLENYVKGSSHKNFPEEIELLINKWMIDKMTIQIIPLQLGRKELEERIFSKYQPKYNTKGQRGTNIKSYTKAEKQAIHKNAYEKWTEEEDYKLEELYCQGSTIEELSKKFARNKGAIESRIRKLELKEKYER